MVQSLRLWTPLYGCFVLSRDWHFMVLQGQAYAMSEPYAATREGIFDIFRILKSLKQIITQWIEQNNLWFYSEDFP